MVLLATPSAGSSGHVADHGLIARVLDREYAWTAVSPAAGGTVTPDLSVSENLAITLPAGNITLAAPTDSAGAMVVGSRLRLFITQDAIGGRVVTFAAAYATPLPVNPVPGALSVLEYVWDGALWQPRGMPLLAGAQAWASGASYLAGAVVTYLGGTYYAPASIAAGTAPPGNGWVTIASPGTNASSVVGSSGVLATSFTTPNLNSGSVWTALTGLTCAPNTTAPIRIRAMVTAAINGQGATLPAAGRMIWQVRVQDDLGAVVGVRSRSLVNFSASAITIPSTGPIEEWDILTQPFSPASTARTYSCYAICQVTGGGAYGTGPTLFVYGTDFLASQGSYVEAVVAG